MWEEYIDYIPNFVGNNISILLGRGCPYSCTYCCNYALRKLTDGNYVRFRSPQNIIEEIRLIHEKYPLGKKFIWRSKALMQIKNGLLKYAMK